MGMVLVVSTYSSTLMMTLCLKLKNLSVQVVGGWCRRFLSVCALNLVSGVSPCTPIFLWNIRDLLLSEDNYWVR